MELTVLEVFEADRLDESALAGGPKVFALGVYGAAAVMALEPAADDPEAAKDVEAPVPLAPEDVFARI